MYLFIYCKPLWEIFFLMFLAVLIWTGCEVVFYGRKAQGKERGVHVWKIANAILFVASLLALAYLVLLARSTGERQVYWEPFHFFKDEPIKEEYYRMLVMNAFAFVPFGLTFSAILPEKIPGWVRWLITIMVGLFMSVGIETIQYFAQLGTVETDDVIFNTLGALIGGFPVLLTNIINKFRLKEVIIKWIQMGKIEETK